ncbi:MAG: hypothetical protein WBZ32_09260, partial [Candidatus Acidiferrales bacterium]
PRRINSFRHPAEGAHVRNGIRVKEIAMNEAVKVGLFVRLEAKPGKESEVESFLKSGLALAQQEPATTTWYAIRFDSSTFGIFDTFPDQAGREAHLSGQIAAALMAKAPDLLSKPPSIEKVDVLAAKLSRPSASMSAPTK